MTATFNGHVFEIVDAYVTRICNLDYFNSEAVAIEVTKPLTARQLDFLRNEGVPERFIEKEENKIFVFNPRYWDIEDAQAEADERIDCLIKNKYLVLDDLLEI